MGFASEGRGADNVVALGRFEPLPLEVQADVVAFQPGARYLAVLSQCLGVAASVYQHGDGGSRAGAVRVLVMPVLWAAQGGYVAAIGQAG